MKKLTYLMCLLFVGLGVAYAGTPQENYYMGQPPLSNTTVFGSSWTSTSPSVILVPPTCSYGSATGSGRICLTKEVVQLSTAAIYYALDAGTTVQYIQGFALAQSSTASGSGTLALPEDHLGPLCFTSGNSVTLKVVGTAVTGLNNAINYEGYSTCGGTANKGSQY